MTARHPYLQATLLASVPVLLLVQLDRLYGELLAPGSVLLRVPLLLLAAAGLYRAQVRRRVGVVLAWAPLLGALLLAWAATVTVGGLLAGVGAARGGLFGALLLAVLLYGGFQLSLAGLLRGLGARSPLREPGRR